jgi:uncharacterized membrane protein
MAAAVIAVATSSIKIPMLNTGGYLNVGDVAVIFLGFLLGPRSGALAGAIGSAAADLIGGYASFAGITFLAKGCEGWIAASLGGPEASWPRRTFGALLAGGVMACWYLAWEYQLVGPAPAWASYPGNLFQGMFGAAGALALYGALIRRE